MLTKSNLGAEVFSLELRCGSIHHLATENLSFENFSSSRFGLNCLKVSHDILGYLRMYEMTSCVETKNAFASLERLSEITRRAYSKLEDECALDRELVAKRP